MNDDFIEHLFNVFGALDRASKRKKEERTAKKERGEGRRVKREAFDEAPSAPAPAPGGKDPSCCTAKR